MSMYNMIFGESSSADQLLSVLGLTRGDFYRYRDCYLDENGRIAVYTRGGGGNRECWCDDHGIEIETHDKGCVVVVHRANKQHPCYLFDRDDDFDSTYATFYFKVPEETDRDKLAEIQPEIGRNDAWLTLLDSLRRATGQ